MKPREVEKLLGGYATDTLTAQEREALFRAALTDQKLFDALADEEALREILRDPDYRRQLMEALRERPPGLGERVAAWLRRPAPLALAGGLAAAGLALVMLIGVREPAKPPVQMAMNREAPLQPEPESAPETTIPISPRTEIREQARKAAVPIASRAPEPVKAEALSPAREQLQPSQAKSLELSETLSLSDRPAAYRQKSAAIVAGRPAGIAYRIERLNADGTYSEVPADTILGVGDAIRLVVEPGASGSLQVVDQRAPGVFNVIFSGAVKAGERQPVPPEGNLPVSGAAGEKKLLLTLFSRSLTGEPLDVSRLFPAAAGESKTPPITVEVVLRFK